MSRFVIAFVLLLCAAPGLPGAQRADAEESYTPGQKIDRSFRDFPQIFLDKYCVDCHDDDSPKGNLSLYDLGPVDETNADTWKSVWSQVTLKEMPPE